MSNFQKFDITEETYYEMENIEQVVIRSYSSFGRTSDCDNALNKNLTTFDTERDFCDGQLSDCEYSGWLDVCRLVS